MRTADPVLRQRRRRQILAAAGKCFIDKGFHQSSMAEIAAMSNLSMGLLYRYFKSKDELVLAFAQRERTESIAALEALNSAKSLRAGLSVFLNYVLSPIFEADYLRIVAEILAESGRNPALLARLRREDVLAMEAMRATLKKLVVNGKISSPTTITHLAMLLTGSIDGLATRVLLDPTLEHKVVKAELLKHWLSILEPRTKN